MYSDTNYYEAHGVTDPAGILQGVSLDVNAAVHELGHTLGLHHIEGQQSINGTNYSEVMASQQYPPLTPIAFLNQASRITDTLRSVVTENPVYYLKRYIDGDSDPYLRSEGIVPGSYDTSTVFNNLRVWFSGFTGSQTLYNVELISSTGDDDGNSAQHFDSITLDQLSQQMISVPLDGTLSLVASSTLDGQPDVVLASGDPTDPSNLSIPVNAGLMQAQLEIFSNSQFSTLSDVTINALVVPEPALISIALGGMIWTCWSRRARV